MSDDSLTDFETLEKLHSDDQRTVWNAVSRNTGRRVRLTIFAPAVSATAGFRRAFKTDRVMLKTLRHRSIVDYQGDGESDGQLFFWTDAGPEAESEPGGSGRPLSVEDVIEIGWQVCSALQQAHNLGLSHGGLNRESVLLAGQTEVSLVDFGVLRWLKAGRREFPDGGVSRGSSGGSWTSDWRREVRADLRDLAGLLQDLLNHAGVADSAGPHRSPPALEGSLRRLLERSVAAEDESVQPVSAREMQGRLGELLIGGEGDQMQLVDQREHLPTSRRSIVDELFDDAANSQPPSKRDEPSAGGGDSSVTQFLPILVGVILLLILLVIAVQLL